MVLSENRKGKLKDLKLNSSVRVSIMCDMIDLVSGSAQYIDNKKSAERQSNVHVNIHPLTEVKSMSKKQLERKNLRYPDICKSGETGSATHVVTEAEYGADFTLTFTKFLSETENLEEAKGQLELGAKELSNIFAIDAEVEGHSKETSQKNVKNIECHFEGDFNLPDDVKLPTTYDEAIEFAKGFAEMTSKSMEKDPKDGKPLGNPINVCLHPLVLIPNCVGAPVLQNQITDELVDTFAEVMEKYKEVEDTLRIQLENPLVKKIAVG